jgi:hypothetical protein
LDLSLPKLPKPTSVSFGSGFWGSVQKSKAQTDSRSDAETVASAELIRFDYLGGERGEGFLSELKHTADVLSRCASEAKITGDLRSFLDCEDGV